MVGNVSKGIFLETFSFPAKAFKASAANNRMQLGTACA